MAKWPAQYRRMMRWCDRIVETADQRRWVDDYDADDLYAFFVTCLHFGDWLWNDPSAKISKTDVGTLIEGERVLRICADVANGVKHLRRDERRVLAHRSREQLLARARELAKRASSEDEYVPQATSLLTLVEILRGRDHGHAKTLRQAMDVFVAGKVNNESPLERRLRGLRRGC